MKIFDVIAIRAVGTEDFKTATKPVLHNFQK